MSEEYLHKKEKVIFKSPPTGKKADATLQKDPHQVVIKNSKCHPKQAAKAAKPKRTFRAMGLDAVLMRDGCLEFKAVVSKKCKF